MDYSKVPKLSFKELELSYDKIEKLSKLLLNDLRIKKPKTYGYKALTEPIEVGGKTAFKTLGYVLNRNSFDDLVNLISTSSVLQTHHHTKGINSIIESLLKKVLKKELLRDRFLQTLIEKLTVLHKFTVYVPVRNVELPMRSLVIGNCRLVKFTQYKHQNLRRTISKVHSKNKTSRKWGLEHLEQYANTYLGLNSLCLEVTIYAGNSNAAIAGAIDQSEESFSILIFLLSTQYKDRTRIQILTAKETFKPREIYFTASETWGSGANMRDRNNLPVQLSKSMWVQTNKYGASKVHNLFAKDYRGLTQFEKRIKQAVLMFSQAMKYDNDAIAFLQLTSILEMFLVRKNESIKQNLSERYALIFHKDKDKRMTLVKEMKLMYDTRCDITHEGEFQLDPDLLVRYRSHVFNFLRFLICYHEDFKSVDEFIRELNALKFTGDVLKPFAMSTHWA